MPFDHAGRAYRFVAAFAEDSMVRAHVVSADTFDLSHKSTYLTPVDIWLIALSAFVAGLVAH